MCHDARWQYHHHDEMTTPRAGRGNRVKSLIQSQLRHRSSPTMFLLWLKHPTCVRRGIRWSGETCCTGNEHSIKSYWLMGYQVHSLRYEVQFSWHRFAFLTPRCWHTSTELGRCTVIPRIGHCLLRPALHPHMNVDIPMAFIMLNKGWGSITLLPVTPAMFWRV